MGQRNFAVISLIITAGCSSTRTIAPRGLGPLHSPVAGKAALLDTLEGGRVRVDANSQVRFTMKSGRRTPWLKARDLRTGEEGLFMGGRVPLSALNGLEGCELSQQELTQLHGAPSARPGCRFFEDGAMRAALATLDQAERIPSGRWRLSLPDGSWTDWMRGLALMQAHDKGLVLESGVLWSDILEAEIRNFSGGKTLGLIVVGAAVAATVIALAAAGETVSPGGSGTSVGHHSGHAAHGVARVVHHGLHITAALLQTHEPLPTWRAPSREQAAQPTLRGSASGSTKLFTGVTRRKAALEVVPSFQAMSTLAAPEGLEQSLALGLRLKQVWEFGGGLRMANLAGPKGDPALRVIGFGRAGLHLNLDNSHRVAVPLSIDIGAGQGVLLQTRLNLGLRIRVSDKLAVGIAAPSPTLLRMRGPNNKMVHRWSFPAGLELSYAL